MCLGLRISRCKVSFLFPTPYSQCPPSQRQPLLSISCIFFHVSSIKMGLDYEDKGWKEWSIRLNCISMVMTIRYPLMMTLETSIWPKALITVEDQLECWRSWNKYIVESTTVNRLSLPLPPTITSFSTLFLITFLKNCFLHFGILYEVKDEHCPVKYIIGRHWKAYVYTSIDIIWKFSGKGEIWRPSLRYLVTSSSRPAFTVN